MESIRFLPLLILYFGAFWSGYCQNVSSRPAAVKIGAIYTFNSTIGRVAKFAIEEAIKEVNADPSVLHGTELTVTMQNSNCSGFLGMVEALQFMETDVVAIIGPQCSTVATIISHVANELKVPLLSFATDPTLTSLQFPYFIRTTQSDVRQMTAAAEIVDYFGWKAVIAIYIDDDYGRNGISALNDKLARKRCKISYKAGISPGEAANRSKVMDILVKVALMESRVIILHVSPDIGFMVFSVAQYLGMMGNGYAWIATDWLAFKLDSNSPLPNDIMDSMQGVLVLRQHTPDSDGKRAFLSNWKNITGGSFGMNSYGYYVYDSVWIVAHALDAYFNQGKKVSFSDDPKLQAMGKGDLNLDAMSIFDGGELLRSKILGSDFVGLTGRLKFGSDRALLQASYDIINVIGTGYRRIGFWSNHSGLTKVPPETLSMGTQNRSNSSQLLNNVIWPGETLSKPRGWVFPNNGKLLRIGVPRRVSYREFVSPVRGTTKFQGFCIDVFTAAVNLLPYAVPFEFVAFGDGKKNPSYTELVTKISTGVFDAAVGDIAIVTNRTKIVDFTQPYAESGLVIVAPFKKLNTGAWAFLRPFTYRMWIVTGSFFLVVGIVVWILEHRINDEFRGPPKKQVMTVLWFSFSTLFFAHRETTVSTLGRMVLIIWMFVVLIINSSYTASLTSILTVQQLSSPIKGLEELIKSDGPVGFQTGSFAEYYLNEELKISKSRLIPLNSPEEYAEALSKGPKKGGVMAVVDERPYVELFLSSQCNFRIVGQSFTRSGWGFAFPKDSPLALDLSTAILELAENGDLQRIHDKWLVKNSCTLDNAELESDRLHLKSFWGLFLICGVACAIALSIYFLQIIRRLRSIGPDQVGSSDGGSRSSHIQKIWSLMDEKKDPSKSSRIKRLKTDTSSSEKYRDEGSGRISTRRESDIMAASESNIGLNKYEA